MLVWNDTLTTGVAEIDAQHKQLINKYNSLSTAMSSRVLSMKEAKETLDFLQIYTIWHFEQEEKAFEQYNCPAAAKNKQEHAQFIELFGQFYEQWRTEGLDSKLVQTTYVELGKWIVNHIQQVDTQLLACVKNDQR